MQQIFFISVGIIRDGQTYEMYNEGKSEQIIYSFRNYFL